MKQEVSPVVAAIVIIAIIGIAAFGWTRFASVKHEDKPPPTMPPAVAKQWADFAKGAPAGPTGPTGSTAGSTIPGLNGPAGAPPRGGSTGAPAGITGNYGR